MPPLLPAARALALLAALGLAGCAGGTRTVTPDRLADAGTDLDGRSGILTMADGTRYLAAALRLDPDSTSWVDPMTGDLRIVSTPSVARIETRDRRRAALRGAGVGALVGAATGAALGVLFCADLGCTADHQAFALGGGLLLAPWGAVGGGVLGAVEDPVDRWWFLRPDDAAAGRGPGKAASS